MKGLDDMDTFGDYAAEIRTIVVEYRDPDSTDKHRVFTTVAAKGLPNEAFVNEITRPIRNAGNVIDGVTELLDGFSLE